ncbi:hypothetical protein DPMN_093880 [Dreissena polymorpha]|uniref:Uncharacterized protein n=1 Tax=Dreissena polymorpha TaxID=45954 RepID=A0A9D4R1F0_DREPO|nr:hypothetical protein DPMN_093880 [Dreissena polymorpha]
MEHNTNEHVRNMVHKNPSWRPSNDESGIGLGTSSCNIVQDWAPWYVKESWPSRSSEEILDVQSDKVKFPSHG